MITANALICGKKIQLIVIKIMSLGYRLPASSRWRERLVGAGVQVTGHLPRQACQNSEINAKLGCNIILIA
ncbi:hypothetical protein [Symbiopectobacterium sp. RP]|uniref:hypothetical protein n=1 Tax=Symbiopectobacterium sp. RP TaxID=3248553 RepID=UPI003D299E5E